MTKMFTFIKVVTFTKVVAVTKNVAFRSSLVLPIHLTNKKLQFTVDVKPETETEIWTSPRLWKWTGTRRRRPWS